MNVRRKLFGVVGGLALGLAAYAAGAGDLLRPADPSVSGGMPVPGVEGVADTIVGSAMPVPGMEAVDEMIVQDD